MPKLDHQQDFKPYWSTTDDEACRLYHGDVISVLGQLPAQSVQCCVTSPPYWGLRDYGSDKTLEIGSEKTPEEYVTKMVAVFREIRRVLRDDGMLWLNLGDSYTGGGSRDYPGDRKQTTNKGSVTPWAIGQRVLGLPSGNLVGIPWRVALALQADGWVLRQDIIWSKTSPMPESVQNRCTKAHEYIFLLTKGMGYFYDAEAIKEAASVIPSPRNNGERWDETKAAGGKQQAGCSGSANKRSVWTVAGGSYPGAHFATFSEKLIEPMILAGTSERGCCVECGTPWERVIEETKLVRDRPNDYVKRQPTSGITLADDAGYDGHRTRAGLDAYHAANKLNTCSNSVAGVESRTVGWKPGCYCNVPRVRPCIVLDPFIGSGTTALVSLRNNRWCWGIDLSESYLRDHAMRRIAKFLQADPDRLGLLAPNDAALPTYTAPQAKRVRL